MWTRNFWIYFGHVAPPLRCILGRTNADAEKTIATDLATNNSRTNHDQIQKPKQSNQAQPNYCTERSSQTGCSDDDLSVQFIKLGSGE